MQFNYKKARKPVNYKQFRVRLTEFVTLNPHFRDFGVKLTKKRRRYYVENIIIGVTIDETGRLIKTPQVFHSPKTYRQKNFHGRGEGPRTFTMVSHNCTRYRKKRILLEIQKDR